MSEYFLMALIGVAALLGIYVAINLVIEQQATKHRRIFERDEEDVVPDKRRNGT